MTVRHSARRAASQERRRLGLDGKGSAPEFGLLRNAVESRNIFVFEEEAELDEMRGMSLSYGLPRVILINSKDSPASKTFTLMHEYGHVLLGKSCLRAPLAPGLEAAAAESWCTRFASSALMQDGELRKECEMGDTGTASSEIIGRLSGKFAVGRTAAAARAQNLGLAARGISDDARRGADASQTKRTTPATRCPSGRGRKFVSLVLASRQAKAISNGDAMDYLDMDLAHTAALLEALWRGA